MKSVVSNVPALWSMKDTSGPTAWRFLNFVNKEGQLEQWGDEGFLVSKYLVFYLDRVGT